MRGLRQVFDPAARMWTFYSPEVLPPGAEEKIAGYVMNVQDGRRTDCLRKFGPGPRFDAFRDSMKALQEKRYRVVVVGGGRESMAFKQTVGTEKLFSVPR
jgi:hypothetical protein